MSERLVYGTHAVTELLRQRRHQVSALLFQAGMESPLVVEARRLGVTPIERSRGELDSLTKGGVHQGVVALCGEFEYTELPELLARGGEAPLLLVLDGVTDPQNLGALIRSVHVLGGHGVVIQKDRAAPVTPAVVKAAAGATELLGVARVTNLVRTMEEMKEAGLSLCAAAAGHRDSPPWKVDMRGPLGLVLGSEGKGLRPLVRRTCDQAVEVPMLGGMQGASLNVAAAGAVLLYEALRQRRVS